MLGIFQPVSRAIDENAKVELWEAGIEMGRKRLHSESVLYVGYYSSHEQTVDEEATRREQALRHLISKTLKKTASR